MKHLRLILAAAVGLASLLVILGAIRIGGNQEITSLSAISSYQQSGSLKRAGGAGVSLEPARRSDQLSHRHAALRFLVDGTEGPADRNLGTPDGPGGALAIHAHDASGVVHLHQARGDEPYRLDDLWAVYGRSPVLMQSKDLQVALWVDGVRRPLGFNRVLSDRQDIVVEVVSPGSGRELSRQMPLDRFSWESAPVGAM